MITGKEKHSVLSIVLVYSPLPQCQEHVTPVQGSSPITDTQSQLPLPLPLPEEQEHTAASAAQLGIPRPTGKGMAFA